MTVQQEPPGTDKLPLAVVNDVNFPSIFVAPALTTTLLLAAKEPSIGPPISPLQVLPLALQLCLFSTRSVIFPLA